MLTNIVYDKDHFLLSENEAKFAWLKWKFEPHYWDHKDASV